MKKPNFCGWATKANIRCSDGRIIGKDAFKDCDGLEVPLMWNHQHTDPEYVLGHALLENRSDGVYAYCYFNDTKKAKHAKAALENGDIKALSIFANHLQQQGKQVLHGAIREVSLVLAGANPGATVDSVIRHGEESDEEAIFRFVYDDSIEMYHSDDDDDYDIDDDDIYHSEDGEEDGEDSECLAIYDSMNEKQKALLHALVGEILEDKENEEKEEDDKEDKKSMKHNVFDPKQEQGGTLAHADQAKIIATAKQSTVGSFKAAMEMFVEQNPDSAIAHGIDSIETLFPDYKDVRPGAPELLTTDQTWINKVLSKVHKSPISRIRTRQADIRNIENLRAKGYKKGSEKKEIGNFGLIHRTTDPQTVFVKSKIDRDDIVDIQDFDVVQYLYNIDRMNLNEELATAILIGDGRQVGADGKIAEDKIRPIWLDDELYTIHKDVEIDKMKAELQGTNTSANFGDNYIYAEAVIQSLLYAREKYKGSGTPDFYCTPHLVNIMLLARDLNGRRIYDKVSDLAAALNVGEIITVEQFENKTRKTDGDTKTKKLLGLMVNLADYSLGATKGGEITHFTDFDIDFNQEKSLLETRCSGANTRVMSAIALEEDITE